MTLRVIVDPVWSTKHRWVWRRVLKAYPAARVQVKITNPQEQRFAALAELVGAVEPARNLVDSDVVVVVAESFPFAEVWVERVLRKGKQGVSAEVWEVRNGVVVRWRYHQRQGRQNCFVSTERRERVGR